MKNSLGVEITETEAELLRIYQAMRRLVEGRMDELEPYQARNTLKALSCFWQIMNGMDMEPTRLYHVGI